MKVGPRQCILILSLISLAKGISFTPSVDFFSMTMLLLLLLLLLILLSLKRRERISFCGCVVKAFGGLLHYHDIIIINVFFNGNSTLSGMWKAPYWFSCSTNVAKIFSLPLKNAFTSVMHIHLCLLSYKIKRKEHYFNVICFSQKYFTILTLSLHF